MATVVRLIYNALLVTTLVYYLFSFVVIIDFICKTYHYVNDTLTMTYKDEISQLKVIYPDKYYAEEKENAGFVEIFKQALYLWYLERESPFYVRRYMKNNLMTAFRINIATAALSAWFVIMSGIHIFGYHKNRFDLLPLPWMAMMDLGFFLEGCIAGYHISDLESSVFNLVSLTIFILDVLMAVLDILQCYFVLCFGVLRPWNDQRNGDRRRAAAADRF